MEEKMIGEKIEESHFKELVFGIVNDCKLLL
jgi:hypothetical protein